MMPEPEELFAALPTPTDSGSAFTAVVQNPAGTARVGKSRAGNPAFLLSVTDATMPPVQLKNLTALFNVRCRLVVGHQKTEESLTVVECTSPDPEVRLAFLRGLKPAIDLMGPSPTAADARRAVENLAEVFRKLSQPPSRSIVGVWGEMLMLARATDPKELIDAWHVDPTERFDFLAGPLRLEVKTTRSGLREHRVGLDQLFDPGARVALASMRTRGAGGGASLQELLDELMGRLTDDPGAQMKAMQGVASSLGTEWSSGIHVRFDRHLAERTFALFDGDDVPSVGRRTPVGVSGVRFDVDLSESIPLKRSDIEDVGGIWAAALPH